MTYNAQTAAANPTNAVDTDPTVSTRVPNAFVHSAQATFWVHAADPNPSGIVTHRGWSHSAAEACPP